MTKANSLKVHFTRLAWDNAFGLRRPNQFQRPQPLVASGRPLAPQRPPQPVADLGPVHRQAWQRIRARAHAGLWAGGVDDVLLKRCVLVQELRRGLM
jgi:hypothetical protein